MSPYALSRSRWAVTIWLITLLYWLVMLIGTHLPVQLLPTLVFAETWDKWRHLVAFAGLAALLCLVAAPCGLSRRQLLMTVMLIIAGYALLDETTQAFVPGRTPDFKDWLADMGGGCLGLLAFTGINAGIRWMRSPATS